MNSNKTQIHRAKISRPMLWLVNNVRVFADARVLHFGEGRAFLDSQALIDEGAYVTAYDPYSPAPGQRDDAVLFNYYDYVIAIYVFNVLEPGERVNAFGDFLTAKGGGTGYIALRTDKIAGAPYEDGVITQKYTFQKSYTGASAIEEFGGKIIHKGSGFLILEIS